MRPLTFHGFNQLIMREADDSINTCKIFLGNLVNYWKENYRNKTQVSLALNGEVLEISIPACKFNCFTETKLVSLDRQLVTEISFYTQEEGKRKRFHQLYIDNDKQLTVTSPSNDSKIDIEYHTGLEELVLNSILEAAVIAKLC